MFMQETCKFLNGSASHWMKLQYNVKNSDSSEKLHPKKIINYTLLGKV